MKGLKEIIESADQKEFEALTEANKKKAAVDRVKRTLTSPEKIDNIVVSRYENHRALKKRYRDKLRRTYRSEIEAMRHFYEILDILPDYSCNTDGRVGGTLVEFKLNIRAVPFDQLEKYRKSYNSAALPIPRYSLFVNINQRKFMFIDNMDWKTLEEGEWEDPEDLKKYLNKKDYLPGWIDEWSIISYNDRFYANHLSGKKEDFIKEIRSPKELNIKPYEEWTETCDLARNMLDCLGSNALRKRLGAFFTPDEYVRIATEYIRSAIARVPAGYDYIILDRCAGTGNLEKFLTDEQLSHCVLNTYVYAEWTTLKGLYDGRVRYIIPHTKEYKDPDGLLSDGDAFTEDFNKKLSDYIEKERKKANGKLVVIGLENPPFAEPGSKTNSDLKTAGSYVNTEMKKDKTVVGRASTDLANQFIWSMTRWYADIYIVFAPIKYWKSQHVFDGKFNGGYLCNRKEFHAKTEAAVSLISWDISEETSNTSLLLQSDLGDREVKKIHKISNALLGGGTKEKKIAEVHLKSGEPNYLNGVLCNTPMNKNAAHRVLGRDNLFEFLPLWTVNYYKYQDYTENGVIWKSGDGLTKYLQDKNFLHDCFVWSCLTNANKCKSNGQVRNELCLLQKTEADKLLDFEERHVELIKKWRKVLKLAKATEEHNPEFSYGLHQICDDINIIIEARQKDTGAIIYDKNKKPVKVHKHGDLNNAIKELKEELKKFYDVHITPKLFKYELLK